MMLQWLAVALIGLLAVWMIAHHFGLGQKKTGCAGCNSCGKPKASLPANRAQLQ
jgi:hypothetical protein